jgi:hypothetical protein
VSVDRIEAQMTVPATQQVSAAVGSSGAAASTLTATSGATYLASVLTDLQTQLNNNVQGYPQTAAAIAAALSAGVFTTGAGYLCNESTGNLASVYGTPATLTANGTPVYNTAGPRAGIDKAIGFDDNADFFAGGTGDFDVNGTSDLIVAWVGKFTGAPSVNEYIFVKGNAGAAAKWTIRYDPADGLIHFLLTSASGTKESTASVASIGVGNWYVGIGVIDRGAGNVRVGLRTLAGVASVGSSTALFAGETLSNVDAFTFGNRSSANACINQLFSAFYIATGTSCASGMAAGLSTALSNFAAAVNAAWSVTRSDVTGRVSIVYSAPPGGAPSNSLDWLSTAYRDMLGFTRNINYAATAAEIAADLGMGIFTTGAGYACNEASGNLASAFGTPATLTASGSPTYGNLGPRGGIDKAIGFASGNQSFDGGNVFDVVATDDLIIAWAGKFSAAGAAFDQLFSKVAAVFASGWSVCLDGAGTGLIAGAGAAGSQVTGSASLTSLYGEWHVGIAVMDRSTGKMRVGLRGITSGTSSISTEATITGSFTTAATFRFGASAWINQAPSTFQCSAFYIADGAGIATGLSANLATALSNFAATFGTWTGAKSAKGVWCPGFQIDMDNGRGDPKQAPRGDDGAAVLTPTGALYGISSNRWYHQRNLAYRMLPKNKVWAADALYVNEDYETFYLDTQRKQHSWFDSFAPLKIYWDNAGVATLLGNGTVSAWRLPNPRTLDQLRSSVDNFTGLVDVELGDAYSAG